MFSSRRSQSSILLTDFYQLTMAYAHWKNGNEKQEAVFHLSFRKNPFQSGFAIFCGLTHLIDFIEHFKFEESDLDYLRTLKNNSGSLIFSEEFLDFLRNMAFNCDIDCMAEGSVTFAHEPILRVRGPIIQCQILETVLLNIASFQTLIATKAARVKLAAGSKKVMEFGLRRAQGSDGALSASWAAYIGGVDSTSNVLAGKIYGIPVVGTLAHSWIMSFDNELESFIAFAEALPENCVFLVDTYNTLEGVHKAVEAGRWLAKHGYKLQGIRLDSGDLAYLSIEARKILDEGGFKDAYIVASNDLDEHIIDSLNDQGAMIDVWAVGTRLITAYDQPALGGVYKLSAVRKENGPWTYKIKLSEQAIKITTPGVQQVRRYLDGSGNFVGDMIFDEESLAEGAVQIVDPVDFTRRKKMKANSAHIDMLLPVYRAGKLVYELPGVPEMRRYAADQLSKLHPSIRRLLNPHQYPVGLESGLHNQKTDLIMRARAEFENANSLEAVE